MKPFREYTARFDGSVPKKTVITKEELAAYADMVDDDFKNAVIDAQKNIFDFHKRQAQQSWLTTKENGVIMGQRIRGLKKSGNLCSRRHRGLSKLGAYECRACKNCGRSGNYYGNSSRSGR